jgi:hypothetical protein
LTKNLILNIELVPATSFGANLRSALAAEQWDIIRKQVYSKAYNVCEICGEIGPKHPVEAHEIWQYNDKTNQQKLIGMIALCPNCHMCKHMGFARVSGKEDQAIKHFMKINKLSKKEAKKCIDQEFKIWEERSKKEWVLDISILKDFGIDINKT